MERPIRSIYPTNTRICFTTEEAHSLVGIILYITRRSKMEVSKLKSMLVYHQGRKGKIVEIQNQINREIQKWSEKMVRLGGTPLSLWKVKIPRGKVPRIHLGIPQHPF